MDTEQNLEARLALMDDDEKQHFKMVVLSLISCYGPDANKAVLMVKIGDELSGLTTLNCDEMEAAEMLVEVNSFFGFLNTMDAPPKEAFN
tara:strand:- start:805 stop:1074 length:270 start_codon:yes stop_codon:yes gene_type:complete